MKKRSCSVVLVIFAFGFFPAQGIFAEESKYEYYTSASREKLNSETQKMGKKLARVFNQDEITSRTRQIDFAEYHSSLKKSIMYATRMASYSSYEKDLKFARDNELFKGLPDKMIQEPDQQIKNDFLDSKYLMMKKNIDEEIETYGDQIQTCLDICETLAMDDLSGFTQIPESKKSIRELKGSDIYKRYLDKRSLFASRWPEISKRIELQFSLWKSEPVSPDAPLIRLERKRS